MKSHAELTKKQLQVLPYLHSCPTYEEAARQANVSGSRSTVGLKHQLSELNWIVDAMKLCNRLSAS